MVCYENEFKMKVLLLANPNARKTSDLFDKASQTLQSFGVELLQPEVKDVGDFAKVIGQYARQVEAVVVGGGDGSLSAAAPAVIENHLTLGVLPLGTANNFAKNLQIPIDLQKACEIIANGRTKDVDICYVNDILFLNVVGLGLSTHVNRQVSDATKKRFGKFGYLMTAFRIALGFRPIKVSLFDGDSKLLAHIRTFQLTICNGKYFGSNVEVSEDASIRDSKMDLCSFEVADIWEGIKLLLRFRLKRLKFNDPIRHIRSKSFRIESSKTRHVDVDGEIKTQTPLDIRLEPKAIRVFC